MDDQKLPPAEQTQPQQAGPDQPIAPQAAHRPDLEVPDSVAQSLLELTRARSQKKKTKLPIGLIVTIVTLIILVILSSTLLGQAKKPAQQSQTGTGTSNQSGTQGVTNQINQDVKSCSNLSTAVSQC